MARIARRHVEPATKPLFVRAGRGRGRGGDAIGRSDGQMVGQWGVRTGGAQGVARAERIDARPAAVIAAQLVAGDQLMRIHPASVAHPESVPGSRGNGLPVHPQIEDRQLILDGSFNDASFTFSLRIVVRGREHAAEAGVGSAARWVSKPRPMARRYVGKDLPQPKSGGAARPIMSGNARTKSRYAGSVASSAIVARCDRRVI